MTSDRVRLEIRLLGALDVVVDGVVGRIPGAGERALLAVLALRPARVVSADRLVDALWDDRLPANPHNALQTRVSKLRRALGSLGADEAVVATVAPGYRLEVDPEQVDASRFAAHVARARVAAARGDAAAAREAYDDALGLWRGPALVDVADAEWAGPEARRLDELRLTAVTERIEVDLQAGRHGEVVVELEALVGEHPLRERLHALLMTALYRSGRQADALAVYQRARDALDRDLGLDPSAELRDLEAAILRHDPSLAPPDIAVDLPRHRGELPAPVTAVVGRDAEIDEVVGLLDDTRLLTITGPGGAGKTTVALAAARRVADAYPDGAWFVDLSGATEDAHVVGAVADTLWLPAVTPLAGESAEARLARQLRSHRCLLVVDNCEQVVDAVAAVVDRVLAGCADVRVLATSREALAVAGEVQYALGPLPLPSAVELFTRRARAVSRGFAPDEAAEASVAEICARLDGMPLAIELAAARVRTLPVAEIAARLGDRFGLLTGGARTAQARHRTLRATVEWSHQLLGDADRVVLRRLSVFRGRFDVDAAEAVCAGDPVAAADVLDLLGRLVDRSLVAAGDGRFWLLETIRQFAADRLAESGETDAVMARSAARLLQVAEEHGPRLRGGEQDAVVRRLAAERDDLRSALEWCVEHDGALGQRLAGALGWFWYHGDHEEGRRYLHRLLDDAGATDPASRGRALQALSLVARPSATLVHPHPGCAAAARESLALLSSVGDAGGAALSKVLLAVEGVAGDDVPGCLDLLDAATAVFADDPWGRALADEVRMKILIRWGDPDEAMAVGDRAAAAFRDVGDLWEVSTVRAHQGYDLRYVGRLTDALAADDEALTIARTAGLYNTVQLMAAEAGILRALLGDEDAARRDLAEAIAVCRRYGYRAGEGSANVGYGYLARRRDDIAAAADHFTHAVGILTEVGYLTLLAAAWSGLGYVAELAGDADGAERAHREVLTIARAVAEAWVIATGLEGLAGVAVLRDDPTRAAELLAAATATREAGRRPRDPLTARDVDRITAHARDLLGDQTFEAVHARARRPVAASELDRLVD